MCVIDSWAHICFISRFVFKFGYDMVAKGEDVLGHRSIVLHMVGACSNLGMGSKVDYEAQDNVVALDGNKNSLS